MDDETILYKRADINAALKGMAMTSDEKRLLMLRLHRIDPVFPCAVGDTVYLPDKDDLGYIISYPVIEVGIDKERRFFRILDEDQDKIDVDEIGVSVFLTESDAEECFQRQQTS